MTHSLVTDRNQQCSERSCSKKALPLFSKRLYSLRRHLHFVLRHTNRHHHHHHHHHLHHHLHHHHQMGRRHNQEQCDIEGSTGCFLLSRCSSESQGIHLASLWFSDHTEPVTFTFYAAGRSSTEQSVERSFIKREFKTYIHETTT